MNKTRWRKFLLGDLPTGKYVWERGVFKRAGVVMKELF
jgi:hypothetical protein